MAHTSTADLTEPQQLRKWMENIMTRLADTTNKLSAMLSNVKAGDSTDHEVKASIKQIDFCNRLSDGVQRAAKASRELMGLHGDLVKAGLTTSSKKIANATTKVQRAMAEAEAAARTTGVL